MGFDRASERQRGNHHQCANPSDKINIIGVVLDGTAIADTTGIVFNSGGSLTVRDSVIRNFTGDGIFFVPNTSTLSQLYVSNTLVSDNGINGIRIVPAGSGTTKGVLDHVQIVNTGGFGLSFVTSTQKIVVTVSDSVSANNAGTGIFAQSNGGTFVLISVQDSKIVNNNIGLQTEGFDALMNVSRSTVEGNNIGWDRDSTSNLNSFADSMSYTNINGNIAPFHEVYQ